MLRRLITLLPFIAAAGVFGALVQASLHPSRLLIAAPIVAGIAVITGALLSFHALFHRAAIAPGALPALLIISFSFADLFVEDTTVRIAIAAVGVVLFYILVRHVLEAGRGEGYTDALVALSEWSGVMIIFTSSAGLLAAITFLNLPIWVALIIFIVVSFFVALTIVRVARAPSVRVAITSGFILSELFAVLIALPTSYWVNGGVLAAVAYVLFALTRGLTGRELTRSLITAGGMGVLLLGTARWR